MVRFECLIVISFDLASLKDREDMELVIIFGTLFAVVLSATFGHEFDRRYYMSQSSQSQGQLHHSHHTSGSSGSQSFSTHIDCTTYREYNDVMNLWLDNPCMDAIRAFQLLADLHQHHSNGGQHCVSQAITNMSEVLATGNHHGCHCHGNIYKHNYQYIHGYENSLTSCWPDSAYKHLFDIFYQTTDINHHQQHTGCISHKHIWKSLHDISTNTYNCQMAIIMNVYYTYYHFHWKNFCSCSPSSVSTTEAPTTKPVTSSSTTMTPTTRAPVTATTPLTTTQPAAVNPTTTKSFIFHVCPKLSTIQDIAQHNAATNVNASVCSSGTHQSPEAFVLEHCTVQNPSSWIQGLKVLDHCDTVPLYTPVATFFNGKYAPDGGNSGVFLGCLQNGFKLGVQPCDQAPTIAHIEVGGIFTKDPNVYYTIQ